MCINRMVFLLVIAILSHVPVALAAPRNILLIIADDYGIDVTRY